MKTVIKLLSALAAVAGVVYIIATYGEQITAWAKKVYFKYQIFVNISTTIFTHSSISSTGIYSKRPW